MHDRPLEPPIAPSVRRFVSLAAAIVLGLSVGYALGWRARPSPGGPPADRREPEEPNRPQAVPTADYFGVLLPSQFVDLGAPIDSRIVSLPYREGDRVEADAVLATFDIEAVRQELRMTEARLRAASAETARAEAELAEARDRLQRIRRTSNVAFSEAELGAAVHQEQIATAHLHAVQAQFEVQQAELVGLRKRVGSAELRAPFEGVVSALYARSAMQVAAGQKLVRLIQPGGLRIRFAAPLAAASRLRVGGRVIARTEFGARLSGTIESIAPEIDPPTQLVFVTALAEPPPQSAGIYASAPVRVAADH
jgi:RND family efflux transporter MFP subunit